MTKRETEQAVDIKQRFWKVTGVQLLVAVIGIGVIASVSRTQEVKPIIVRTEGESLEPRQILPSIAFLLSEKESIRLSDKQIVALRRLQEDADKELLPIDDELQVRQTVFDRFMKSHKKKQVSMEELLRQAKPVTETGRKKRLVLARYTQQAQILLFEKQRVKACKLFKGTAELVEKQQDKRNDKEGAI